MKQLYFLLFFTLSNQAMHQMPECLEKMCAAQNNDPTSEWHCKNLKRYFYCAGALNSRWNRVPFIGKKRREDAQTRCPFDLVNNSSGNGLPWRTTMDYDVEGVAREQGLSPAETILCMEATRKALCKLAKVERFPEPGDIFKK